MSEHQVTFDSGETFPVADEHGCLTCQMLMHARASVCMAMCAKEGPGHDKEKCLRVFQTAFNLVRGNRPPSHEVTLEEAQRVWVHVNAIIEGMFKTRTQEVS